MNLLECYLKEEYSRRYINFEDGGKLLLIDGLWDCHGDTKEDEFPIWNEKQFNEKGYIMR